MKKTVVVASTFFLVLLSSSCEDEEMAAKRKTQEQQLEVLRAELGLVRDRLDANWSKDQSSELSEEKLAIEEAKGAIDILEKELASLRSDLEQAEKMFDDYKTKFPVGN